MMLRTAHYRILPLVCLAALALAPVSRANAQSYTITDLGLPPGMTDIHPSGVTKNAVLKIRPINISAFTLTPHCLLSGLSEVEMFVKMQSTRG